MSGRKLEVTEEILDLVVYGMENQKQELYLDPENGRLTPQTGDRKPLIPMPEWSPADGFRLMDGFVSTLPDAPFRRRLSDILHSGTGVFRRFKDALKDRPGTEGIWFRYKQREMRKVAFSWLSRWSDALELESLGPEPEEWEDLPLSEFSFRELDDRDAGFLDSSMKGLKDELDQEVFLLGVPPSPHTGWIAEAPGGLPVGVACLTEGEGRTRLGPVYVLPDFRGMGIGRTLTGMALDTASGPVTMAAGRIGEATGRWLESLGFEPVLTFWRKSR